MSGTISLPDDISISQNDVSPGVTIAVAEGAASMPGLPVYPLSSDPAQAWSLQETNGVLAWVQYARPPGQGAIMLEAGGALRLESGGMLLMEL